MIFSVRFIFRCLYVVRNNNKECERVGRLHALSIICEWGNLLHLANLLLSQCIAHSARAAENRIYIFLFFCRSKHTRFDNNNIQLYAEHNRIGNRFYITVDSLHTDASNIPHIFFFSFSSPFYNFKHIFTALMPVTSNTLLYSSPEF